MSRLDSCLKAVYLQTPENIIFSYFKIDSTRNKFNSFCNLISLNVDIFSIAETKFDNCFPNAQFLIPNFYQLLSMDISANSGGLLVLHDPKFWQKC